MSPSNRILAHLIFLCASVQATVAQTGLQFIQNRGQWPDAVTYRADAPSATVWVERSSLLIDRYDATAMEHLAHAHTHGGEVPRTVAHHALRLGFAGANPDPIIEPLGIRPGAYNYILGNDASRWVGKAHAFGALVQKDIYPGVDLRIRAKHTALKYDLLLAAEAEVGKILLHYEGAERIELTPDRLIIHTALGALTESIPLAYQEIAGERRHVECTYRRVGDLIGFELGVHDPTAPVVIDPTLVFSTYSGSFANNFGYTATFDRNGFLYSGSTAFGQGYPTTTGAYQVSHAGGDGLFDGTDIALTKYDTTGTFLIWSTYLGGSSDELPHSLIVNGNDEVFVYGTTSSPNFPTTARAFDGTFHGGPPVDLTNGLGADMPNGADMIVARLSADGSQLLASTYLGGSGTDGLNTAAGLKFNYADEVRGEVLLDANDNVYIASCTASPDMPVTIGSIQPVYGGGAQDGVVVKMDASLTSVIWGSYFGGTAADAIYNIELNSAGALYVTGGTRSTDLPVTSGAYQSTFQGGTADGFVALIGGNGATLLASSYFGTSGYDQCYFAELDQEGQVYLFGQTTAVGNVLIVNAPYNVPNAGQFISKMDPGLTAIQISTRFGQGDGIPDISPTAFLVDYCDKIYVSGWGSAIQGGQLSTAGLPVTPDGFQQTTDGNDFYLAVFDIDLSDLFYATYFGGGTSAEHVDGGTSRFDRRGRVYQSVCAGCGGNSDFPIQPNPGAWSPTNNSGFCNNGVFKFDFDLPIVVADFGSSTNCLPTPITFNNQSYGATDHAWQFGDGTSSTLPSPSHLYAAPGVYTVTLIASNASTCNLSDTTTQQIVILGDGNLELPDTTICSGGSVQIGILPIADPSVTYQWSPSQGLSNATASNPFASPIQTNTYALTISNGTCSTTARQTVIVSTGAIDAGAEQLLCGPDPVTTLVANGFGSIHAFQWSSTATFSDTLNAPIADSTALVMPLRDTWYFARALDQACSAVDSVLLRVSLAVPLLFGDSTICTSDIATLELSGIDPGSTITWEPTDGIISGQGTTSVQVAPEETMGFGVTVLSPLGCIWNATTIVVVSPLDGTSVIATATPSLVLPGESVQLQAFPTDAASYSWSPTAPLNTPNIATPIATVTASTLFTVTVSDGICTKDAFVRVEVHDLRCADPDIFVPNTFTPNGDGNNDVLYVRGRAVERLNFELFDRWGELIFQTTDLTRGWDGTYKGKPVDPAVFVYHLTAYCIDGQRYFTKGNVTVLR
ncbi:MAG: gliding motility-associated C-terminal domain-containing protein [Flavobacteriales bacterium]|nr:gliding motility-associated C-terminal domain-containing protein [Flavobacteriales bacterium]